MDEYKYYLYFLTEKQTLYEQNPFTFVIIYKSLITNN